MHRMHLSAGGHRRYQPGGYLLITGTVEAGLFFSVVASHFYGPSPIANQVWEVMKVYNLLNQVLKKLSSLNNLAMYSKASCRHTVPVSSVC